MAVATAAGLVARLDNAIRLLSEAPIMLPDIALDTIADVSAAASAMLTDAEEYQVGFDLPQLIENMSRPGPLVITSPGVGRIGILSEERMGTVEDFEKIADEPGLFHQGTRDRRGVWRNVVYPNAALRAEVAAERRQVWGDKTPQWRLLHDGYAGDGAYPATPPHPFVDDTVTPGRVIPRMLAAFKRLLSGI